MKSRLAAALLAGVACLSLLTACDDDKKKEQAVKIYKNIDECRVDHSESDCQKAFDGATEVHQSSAPRIPTREECIAKYGVDACVSRRDPNTGNEWFVPAMAGFMLGHVMGNLTAPSYQPVYIDRGGMAYSGNQSLGNWRSSCGPNDYSCRHGGGYVTAPVGSSPAWTRSYTTTTVVTTTPSAPGKPAVVAPAASARAGFGSSASSAATGGSSIGKSTAMGNTSVAAPSMGSARGGFGGAASAGASAGG